MDTVDLLFFIVEIIGTIAFAISGAMIAIERELDLFGVCFLGAITACGGGILRDVILGQTPPQSFINYVYLTTAVITSLIVFLIAAYRRKHTFHMWKYSDAVLNVFDAAGLGIFSIIGVQNTVNAGYGDNAFFCIFLGMTTGVGGGMLRDMMSKSTPAIFRKHIYAVASIIGAICYYYLRAYGRPLAILVTTGVVILIRVLAAHYRWTLPRLTNATEK